MNEENKNNEELKETEETNQNNEPINEPNVDVEAEYKTKIEECEKKISELNDRILRNAAEFENYKKRSNKEMLDLYKYAAENFITSLLPVVDDFERSIDAMSTAKDIESVKTGVDLIFKKFMKILEDQGVKAIDAKGKKFDVHLHDAIARFPSKDQEPDTILENPVKGYYYKDKVIRHASVVVSAEIEPENTSGNLEG